MIKNGYLIFALLFPMLPAQAAEDFINKKSEHPVAVTMDRLEAALKKRGAGIVARVDHAKAAKSAKMELRPTQVLIFGNPKLGTPLMIKEQQVGLDLPLKVLVWQDVQGQTWLTYEHPETMANRHKIKEPAEILKKMAGVLDAVTTEAAGK